VNVNKQELLLLLLLLLFYGRLISSDSVAILGNVSCFINVCFVSKFWGPVFVYPAVNSLINKISSMKQFQAENITFFAPSSPESGRHREV
jgi:hypothetical protein